MEVCTNENGNGVVATEDLSWALQIGDLDTVKEHLQRLAKENGVIVFTLQFGFRAYIYFKTDLRPLIMLDHKH